MLTDIHFDSYYLPGSEAECSGQDNCCDESNSSDIKHPAEFWGNKNCNLPRWTLDSAIKQLAQEHYDVEFILLLGDYPPSRNTVTQRSKFENIVNFEHIMGIFNKYFYKKGEYMKIYAILGNHDTFPVDTFNFQANQMD